MNQVNLVGRLTKDPELQVVSSGKKYVRFTLAVNRYNSQADFISCIAWEKRAETIANYLRKGSQVAINGNINVRSYETQTGEKRWSTDVIVDNFYFLDNKSSNSESSYDKNKDTAIELDDFDMDDDDDGDFPF